MIATKIEKVKAFFLLLYREIFSTIVLGFGFDCNNAQPYTTLLTCMSLIDSSILLNMH